MKILVSVSDGSDWWKTLSEEQQREYLKTHTGSRLKITHHSKPSAKTKRVGVKTVAEKPLRKLTAADADPSKWPDHIKAVKIPPAWKNVHYDESPDADLLATGVDAKGRKQSVYSEAFAKKQSALQFSRVLELDKKFGAITKENSVAIAGDDPKKSHAECLSLIMKMGLRPGGDTDTKAEKQAYGATTLESRHVVEEDGKMFLRFVGKKGVDINLEVDDKELASMLKRRKQEDPNAKLFPNVSADTLSAHTHSLDGGGFHTKDFRTRLGTKTANDLVKKYRPVPANEKEYKSAVKKVATAVSRRLGNTPTVALQSYIAPQIFSQWKT